MTRIKHKPCARLWAVFYFDCAVSRIILGMGLANDRRRYIVTSSLIELAYTQCGPRLSFQQQTVNYFTVITVPGISNFQPATLLLSIHLSNKIG